MDFNRDLKNLQETYMGMVAEESHEEVMCEIGDDVKVGDINEDGYEIVEIYVSEDTISESQKGSKLPIMPTVKSVAKQGAKAAMDSKMGRKVQAGMKKTGRRIARAVKKRMGGQAQN